MHLFKTPVINHLKIYLLPLLVCFSYDASSDSFVLNFTDRGYLGMMNDGSIYGPYLPGSDGPPAGMYDPDGYESSSGYPIDSQAIYEFDLGALNTNNVLSATFLFQPNDISQTSHSSCFNFIGCPVPDTLELYGYAADGDVTTGDYNAGPVLLAAYNLSTSINSPLSFDATQLINDLLTSNDSFAGFNFRVTSPGAVFLSNATLNITTVPIPGALFLFTSALAGLWLAGIKNRR